MKRVKQIMKHDSTFSTCFKTLHNHLFKLKKKIIIEAIKLLNNYVCIYVSWIIFRLFFVEFSVWETLSTFVPPDDQNKGNISSKTPVQLFQFITLIKMQRNSCKSDSMFTHWHIYDARREITSEIIKRFNIPKATRHFFRWKKLI